MNTWRVYIDPPLDGALNMARDEAILNAVSAGAQPPTLRLYAWSPPCLSLGYGQRVRDVDRTCLADRGWTLVRRPTGGRAILHADELTYSLALPIDHELARGTILESYQRISVGLLAALHQLGAKAQIESGESRAPNANPVCFETTSAYEIAVDRRKLVGSAQLRRERAILQHGSLPLTGDLARIGDVLAYPDEEARAAAKKALHARALTLQTALDGEQVTWEHAAHAMREGFRQTFVLSWDERGLSEAELDDAAALTREKYAAPAWTDKR
jgi:lipoate-protein ligase A